jgi:hypothetical protein
MGAYTNPEVAIDTQSGQYLRSAIASVAGAGVSILESRRKLQEEQKKKDELAQDKANSQMLTYATNFSKLGGVDNTLDLQYTMDQTVQPIADLAYEISKGTGKDMSYKIGEYTTMVNNSLNVPKDFLGEASMFGEAYKESNSKGIGVLGGRYSGVGLNESQKTNYDEYVKTGSILSQQGTKKTNTRIDLTNRDFSDANMTIDYEDVNGRKGSAGFNYKALQLQNVTFPEGMYTIPDITSDLEAIKLTVPNIFETKVDKDGKSSLTGGINIQEALKAGYGEVIIQEEIGSTDQKGNPLTTNKYKLFKPNIDKIVEQSEELRAQVGAKVVGMVKTDPRGLAMLYNDVLLPYAPKGSKAIPDIDDISQIDTATVNKAYAKYLVSMQFRQEAYPMKDAKGGADMTVEKYVKPTQPRAQGGAVSAAKTAAYNARVTKNIATIEGNKEGTIKGTDGLTYIYDKNKGWGYMQETRVGGVKKFVPANRDVVIENTKKL